MVVVPTLFTAFSLFATFELNGRAKGSKGLFGWVRKLPWKDVRFFAPFMGMLVFIPAGAGGLINASNQMNAVVHNTLWVTGHFHLTVATSVALTFFGIGYWLIPAVTGRVLTAAMNRLGIAQTVLWCLGMLFMSGAMHVSGLLGNPRRTDYTTYNDSPESVLWMPYHTAMAVGGIILFISLLVLIRIVVGLLRSPKGKTEYPIGEVYDNAEKTPRLFERWGLWIAVSAVLIVVAYTVPLIGMIAGGSESPGYVMW